MIGIYLSKIFIETKQRPYTIVGTIYERAADGRRRDPAERSAATTPRGCAQFGADGARRRLELGGVAGSCASTSCCRSWTEPARRSLNRLRLRLRRAARHLRARGWPVAYRGFDISADDDRRRRWRGTPATRRCVVRQRRDRPRAGRLLGRQRHLQRKLAPRRRGLARLRAAHAGRRSTRCSERGFAFNMLTTLLGSRTAPRRSLLRRPVEMFDLLQAAFSRRVALLHDYPLYEFTMLVRK